MSFKEKLIKKLENLNESYSDWSKKTDFSMEDLIIFWKSNWNKVKKLVKENQFTLDDFNIITKFIDYMLKYCFIWIDSQQIEEFQDILKAQIALSFQYNARVEKYLYKFDPKSSYFKKVKALSLIRFTKWSIDELKYIFWELCLLIADAIEQDPENIEECNNIIKEYINILYSSWAIFWNLWDDIIMNYSVRNERIKIISNENMSKRLHNIYAKKRDDLKLNREWLDKKIDNMINYMKNNWYRNIPNKSVIDEKLSPMFMEYDKLEKKYNELSKITEQYSTFEDWDTYWIYEKWEKLLPDYNELKEYYKDTKRFIVSFKNDIPDDEQDIIINKLRKEYGLNFVKESDANINVKLEEDLLNTYSGLEYYTREIINELVKICSNEENIEYNDEYEENKEKLLKMQEMVDSLLKDNSDLQKKDKDKDKKIDQLLTKKAELESVIEKNSNFEADGILDKDIKDKRKNYRITVVWGADKSIKWYNFNMKDNKFKNRLHNDFYLNEKQFDLKWSYNQQKNKNLKRDIEDDLIFDRADIVIVLQTDHETEFKNRINEIITDKNNPYWHRITEFWELEENWQSKYNDQKFTADRFYHYLDKALTKYELHQENNNIGL